jgi:hypothetical protein
MGNSGQIGSEAMSAETELLEVDSWRMVESTFTGGFGFKLSSLEKLFVRHIREVIQPSEKCLILTA